MKKTLRTAVTLSAVAAYALLSASARAETLLWNFDNVPQGNPTSVAPSSSNAVNFILSGGLSRVNNGGDGTTGNQFINSTSASGTGFSGGNNAATVIRRGSLNFTTSSYFEFSVTPNSGYAINSTDIIFGSRSTSTGPDTYAFYASSDAGFANPTLLASGSLNVGASPYQLVNATNYNYIAPVDKTVTFRLYGYGNSGSTSPGAGQSSWRIDDLTVEIPEPGTFSLALLGVVPLGAMVLRRRRTAR